MTEKTLSARLTAAAAKGPERSTILAHGVDFPALLPCVLFRMQPAGSGA
jgi:hypothetical protein